LCVYACVRIPRPQYFACSPVPPVRLPSRVVVISIQAFVIPFLLLPFPVPLPPPGGVSSVCVVFSFHACASRSFSYPYLLRARVPARCPFTYATLPTAARRFQIMFRPPCCRLFGSFSELLAPFCSVLDLSTTLIRKHCVVCLFVFYAFHCYGPMPSHVPSGTLERLHPGTKPGEPEELGMQHPASSPSQPQAN